MLRSTVSLLLALAPLTARAQTVFINELHYDNVGADANEAIEIAGPAGLDVTGWTIVFYNGSGGATYATMPLTGTIADACNGRGTLSFSQLGIQNGAPDGLALVDPIGEPVQFLSYEGTFTAVGGPANGLTSADIGIAEDGTQPATSSLYLTGTGTQPQHFTWTEGTATPGACNIGQTFGTPVDNPPTLVSTLPAQGADAVALNSNVVVTFNEPVVPMVDAFVLTCTESGAHAFAVSANLGLTVYTLNPDVDFDFVEDCDLDIVANEITDQDGTPEHLATDVTVTFSTAAMPGDYYATADPTNAATLRATLNAIIDDHTRFPYTSGGVDTWDILDLVDQDPANSANVLDVYKNESYAKAGAGNSFYNREHRWAKSFGFPDDTSSSSAYTDVHHLIVSNSNYNSARNNRYFDDCADACTEYPTTLTNGIGGGSGTYPGNSNWGKGERWETWNYRKGDVARAMLYMDVRYEGGINAAGHAEPNLVLTDDPLLIQVTGVNTTGTAYLGLLAVLIEWHELDPPDALEVIRNDLVQTYQQNRNPFVDHPEWVACVFESDCGVPSNLPPVFADAGVGIVENMATNTLVATLAATDPDATQTLSYTILSGNESGAFALATDGALTVANMGLLNFEVTPSFTLTVRATDNGAPPLSDDATIIIALTNVDEGSATANNDIRPIDEDSTATALFVRGNDSADPDTGELTITTVGAALHGTASLLSNDVVYAPAPNYCGDDELTYAVNGGDTATVNITVACLDDGAAIANDDIRSIDEDSTATALFVRGNDSADPDTGELTITAVGAALHGTASLISNDVVYAPSLNYCGHDEVTYAVNGGTTATVNITVACVDDGAAIANDDFLSIEQDGTIEGLGMGVLSNDVADPDDGSLSIIAVGQPTYGTVSVHSGLLVYMFAEGFCGMDSVIYTVNGGDTAIWTIQVVCGDDIFGSGFEG